MKRIGLIINPIAGMGGKVGLKGTDGLDILKKAQSLGAQPEAYIKAKRALECITDLSESICFFTGSGDMGALILEELNFNFEIVHQVESNSTQLDTHNLTQALSNEGVDIIIFVGGDGTARDILSSLDTSIPVIGVPAGVKIYSAVHANSPESAGRLLARYIDEQTINFILGEVIDLDEEGFRNDDVDIKLFGYLRVPEDDSHMQNLKSPSPQSDATAQESIALDIIDHLQNDVLYIIGSGTTPSEILVQLGEPVTILGIDLLYNGKTIATDVNEQDIISHIKSLPHSADIKLIITPMGGQGYLIGRGNQQLSERVLAHIKKDNIIITATPGKLRSLHNRDMLIYTLDNHINNTLTGYYKVTTGYGKKSMYKVSTKQ